MAQAFFLLGEVVGRPEDLEVSLLMLPFAGASPKRLFCCLRCSMY